MAGVVVRRWKFTDPYDPNPATREWTVPVNPNRMTPLFPTRSITAKHTTAPTGQVLMFEGAPTLTEWTFGGAILNKDHHEKLKSWVYDRPNRIQITDHFGRVILCVLRAFKPEPKRDMRRYWRHNYTIEALVISVGDPTVDNYEFAT